MTDWTPAEISTGLWLDASDSSTITISTGVSIWADKSGNGRDFLGGNSSNQPAYTSAGLNGLNVVTFDGSNDYLQNTSYKGFTQPLAIFCVCRSNGTAHTGALVVNGNTSYPMWLALTTAGYLQMNAGSTITGSVSHLSAAVVVSAIFYGSSSIGRADGTAELSGAVGSNYLNAGAVIGNSSAYSMGIVGFIAELIFIPAADLTDALRQKLEGYLAWKWGLNGNLPTDHIYYDSAPQIVPDGIPQRGALDQTYSLLFPRLTAFDQLYSLRQLARLDQLYWNLPQYRNKLVERWGDCPFMRRLLDQDYGQLLQYRAEFDQLWWMPEALRNAMIHRWSVAEDALRSHCDLIWDLSEYDRHRAQLQQLWVLVAGGSIVLDYQVQVLAINGPDVLALSETSGQVTRLHPFNITQEQDQGQYHMSGELHLADAAGFRACKHLRTIIQISVNGRTARYVVEDPRREKGSDGSTIYVVPLASPTLLLGHSDSPYSATEDMWLTGMGSSLVTMLASPVAEVDWRMVDSYIPPSVWRTNGKRRIELIRELVNGWGGIVQTLPDGTLVCRPKYPVDVDRWVSALPDVQLTDQEDFFSIVPSPDPRDGYNCFYLADNEVAGDGVTIVDEAEDAWTRRVKIYLQPWDEAETVRIRHSGGSWVGVVSLGVGIGSEKEQIEIVGGAGQLPLPVWAIAGYDYKEADLGVLTADEDGTVSTEVAGNSLVEVTWLTRYHQFLVRDPRAEDVQIWPEVS